MVLPMARPFKHPKTGIYWFRKRVPADLVDATGRKEVTQSLETRDPAEAKQRYAEVLKEHEVRWATMRAGSRNLTEREAHGLAAVFYEKWMALHRDDPSLEVLWHPQHYKELWTFTPLPEMEPEPGVPGSMPFENMVVPAMRRFCLVQAEYALEHFGHAINDWNRLIVAKATAAAMQRAHFALKRQAEGFFEPGEDPPDPRIVRAALKEEAPAVTNPIPNARSQAAKGQSMSLSGLLEGWWREAKAAGRKPSTYESYRNTFAALIDFLGHDDAGRVTRDDVIRFKDYRLTTPSPKQESSGRPRR